MLEYLILLAESLSLQRLIAATSAGAVIAVINNCHHIKTDFSDEHLVCFLNHLILHFSLSPGFFARNSKFIFPAVFNESRITAVAIPAGCRDRQSVKTI